MSKKTQVNQVFVYMFSIIIIVFAGFLVTKFVFTFTDDVEKRAESTFYKQFEKDYTTIYTSYGSEKIFNYKVSNNVEIICFAQKKDCIDSLPLENITDAKESFKLLFENRDTIVMFDSKSVINSHRGPIFNLENDCMCIKPKFGRFTLILENKRNIVYLKVNE